MKILWEGRRLFPFFCTQKIIFLQIQKCETFHEKQIETKIKHYLKSNETFNETKEKQEDDRNNFMPIFLLFKVGTVFAYYKIRNCGMQF